jgi:hypothetical protein
MPRLPVTCTIRASIVTSVILAIGSSASAEMSDFNTSTNDLGWGYQLVDTFEILYSGENAYFDWNLDNIPESVVPFGQPDTLGEYTDPEHYVLEIEGGYRPQFMGNELTAAAVVDWRLSYTTTAGGTDVYSTIMSGSASNNGDMTMTLEIALGLEWPVNGVPPNTLGIPEHTHVAALIADFTSFTWDGENLSANVIPAPASFAALLLAGLAGPRRRR